MTESEEPPAEAATVITYEEPPAETGTVVESEQPHECAVIVTESMEPLPEAVTVIEPEESPTDAVSVVETEELPAESVTAIELEEPPETIAVAESEEPPAETVTVFESEEPAEDVPVVESKEPPAEVTVVEYEGPPAEVVSVETEESPAESVTTMKSEEPPEAVTVTEPEEPPAETVSVVQSEESLPEPATIIETEKPSAEAVTVVESKELPSEAVTVVEREEPQTETAKAVECEEPPTDAITVEEPPEKVSTVVESEEPPAEAITVVESEEPPTEVTLIESEELTQKAGTLTESEEPPAEAATVITYEEPPAETGTVVESEQPHECAVIVTESMEPLPEAVTVIEPEESPTDAVSVVETEELPAESVTAIELEEPPETIAVAESEEPPAETVTVFESEEPAEDVPVVESKEPPAEVTVVEYEGPPAEVVSVETEESPAESVTTMKSEEPPEAVTVTEPEEPPAETVTVVQSEEAPAQAVAVIESEAATVIESEETLAEAVTFVEPKESPAEADTVIESKELPVESVRFAEPEESAEAVTVTESEELAAEAVTVVEPEESPAEVVTVVAPEESPAETVTAIESDELPIEPVTDVESKEPVSEAITELPAEAVTVIASEEPVAQAVIVVECEEPPAEAVTVVEAEHPPTEAATVIESEKPPAEAVTVSESEQLAAEVVKIIKSEGPPVEEAATVTETEELPAEAVMVIPSEESAAEAVTVVKPEESLAEAVPVIESEETPAEVVTVTEAEEPPADDLKVIGSEELPAEGEASEVSIDGQESNDVMEKVPVTDQCMSYSTLVESSTSQRIIDVLPAEMFVMEPGGIPVIVQVQGPEREHPFTGEMPTDLATEVEVDSGIVEETFVSVRKEIVTGDLEDIATDASTTLPGITEEAKLASLEFSVVQEREEAEYYSSSWDVIEPGGIPVVAQILAEMHDTGAKTELQIESDEHHAPRHEPEYSEADAGKDIPEKDFVGDTQGTFQTAVQVAVEEPPLLPNLAVVEPGTTPVIVQIQCQMTAVSAEATQILQPTEMAVEVPGDEAEHRTDPYKDDLAASLAEKTEGVVTSEKENVAYVTEELSLSMVHSEVLSLEQAASKRTMVEEVTEAGLVQEQLEVVNTEFHREVQHATEIVKENVVNNGELLVEEQQTELPSTPEGVTETYDKFEAMGSLQGTVELPVCEDDTVAIDTAEEVTVEETETKTLAPELTVIEPGAIPLVSQIMAEAQNTMLGSNANDACTVQTYIHEACETTAESYLARKELQDREIANVDSQVDSDAFIAHLQTQETPYELREEEELKEKTLIQEEHLPSTQDVESGIQEEVQVHGGAVMACAISLSAEELAEPAKENAPMAYIAEKITLEETKECEVLAPELTVVEPGGIPVIVQVLTQKEKVDLDLTTSMGFLTETTTVVSSESPAESVTVIPSEEPPTEAVTVVESVEPPAEDVRVIESEEPAAEAVTVIESDEPSAEAMAVIESEKPQTEAVTVVESEELPAEAITVIEPEEAAAEAVTVIESEEPPKEAATIIESVEPAAEAVTVVESDAPSAEAMAVIESDEPLAEPVTVDESDELPAESVTVIESEEQPKEPTTVIEPEEPPAESVTVTEPEELHIETESEEPPVEQLRVTESETSLTLAVTVIPSDEGVKELPFESSLLPETSSKESTHEHALEFLPSLLTVVEPGTLPVVMQIQDPSEMSQFIHTSTTDVSARSEMTMSVEVDQNKHLEMEAIESKSEIISEPMPIVSVTGDPATCDEGTSPLTGMAEEIKLELEDEKLQESQLSQQEPQIDHIEQHVSHPLPEVINVDASSLEQIHTVLASGESVHQGCEESEIVEISAGTAEIAAQITERVERSEEKDEEFVDAVEELEDSKDMEPVQSSGEKEVSITETLSKLQHLEESSSISEDYCHPSPTNSSKSPLDEMRDFPLDESHAETDTLLEENQELPALKIEITADDDLPDMTASRPAFFEMSSSTEQARSVSSPTPPPSSYGEIEEILPDGTVVKRKLIRSRVKKMVTRKILKVGPDGEIIEDVITEEVPESEIGSETSSMMSSVSGARDLMSPPLSLTSPVELASPTGSVSSRHSLRVYTDTVEGEPQTETDVKEYEETLPDGRVIIRKVIKTRQRQTIVKRLVMEGPETEEETRELMMSGALTPEMKVYADKAEMEPEMDTEFEEIEETLPDGTVVKKRVTKTMEQHLSTERRVLEGAPYIPGLIEPAESQASISASGQSFEISSAQPSVLQQADIELLLAQKLQQSQTEEVPKKGLKVKVSMEKPMVPVDDQNAPVDGMTVEVAPHTEEPDVKTPVHDDESAQEVLDRSAKVGSDEPEEAKSKEDPSAPSSGYIISPEKEKCDITETNAVDQPEKGSVEIFESERSHSEKECTDIGVQQVAAESVAEGTEHQRYTSQSDCSAPVNISEENQGFAEPQEAYPVVITEAPAEEIPPSEKSVELEIGLDTPKIAIQEASPMVQSPADEALFFPTEDIKEEDVDEVYYTGGEKQSEEVGVDSVKPSDTEIPAVAETCESQAGQEEGMAWQERPLSPTDYTLEPEAEPEGRIGSDTSQQIFIEQSIEATRPPDDRPPSPSDYTLVTDESAVTESIAAKGSIPEDVFSVPEPVEPRDVGQVFEPGESQSDGHRSPSSPAYTTDPPSTSPGTNHPH